MATSARACLAAASGLRGLSELRRSLDEEADGGFRAAQGPGAPLLPGFGPLRRGASGDPRKGSPQRRMDQTERRHCRARRRARRLGAERRAGDVEQARLRRLKRAAPLLDSDPGAGGGGSPPSTICPRSPPASRRACGRRSTHCVCRRRSGARPARGGAPRPGSRGGHGRRGGACGRRRRSKSSSRRAAAMRNDKRDLPGVQREADEFLSALERHAQIFGPGRRRRPRSPHGRRRPESRRRASSSRRAGPWKPAAGAKAAELPQAQKSHEEARIARETDGAAPDPGPLREKYAALGKVAEAARRAAESRVALTKEERELAEAAARLDPPIEDLEAFARRPIPSP